MLFTTLLGLLRRRPAHRPRRPLSPPLALEPLGERCLLSGGLTTTLVPPALAPALAAPERHAMPLHLQGAGSATLTATGDGALAGNFHAAGEASGLGHWTNVGAIVFTPVAGQPGAFSAQGTVVFVAGNGDLLTGTITGTLTALSPTKGVGQGIFTWTGGTGRFANASGTAPFTVDQNLADNSFTFETTPGAVIAYDGPAPPTGPVVSLAGTSLSPTFEDTRSATSALGTLAGTSPLLGGALTGRFDNVVKAAGNQVSGVLVLNDADSGDALVVIFEQTYDAQAGLWEGTYTVVGGTGQYAGASGSGVIFADPDAPGGVLVTFP